MQCETDIDKEEQSKEEIIQQMIQLVEEVERKKQKIIDLRAYLDKLTKKYYAMPKDAEDIDRVLICSKHELGRKLILLAASDAYY